ncbi:uncharacterized protein [Engystomops pustulosus]|uniref:uncharacterized protein n=1 Tax=Engystomops pustulosus TaxID=76066 RepID=UPI003AFA9F8D
MHRNLLKTQDSRVLATAAPSKMRAAEHSKVFSWLEQVVGTDPGVMTRLPSIYLKCTSMIMDTINFSIDYTAPFTSSILHRSCTPRPSRERHHSGAGAGSRFLHLDLDVTPVIKYYITSQTPRSDVEMTLQYVGSGLHLSSEILTPKDELRMFQQICGGESLCVFKGYLSPGDSFRIISRRHYGFPFSASIYINGLIAARISWCCEYRHQGRHGCFRITQRSGGRPCYRCIQVHEKYQTRPGRKQSAGSTGTDHRGNEEEIRGNIATQTGHPNKHRPAPPGTQPPTTARRRRRRRKKPPRIEASDSDQENQLQDTKQRSRRKGSRTSSKSKEKTRSDRPENRPRPAEPHRTGPAHKPSPTDSGPIIRAEPEPEHAPEEPQHNNSKRNREKENKERGLEIHQRLIAVIRDRTSHSDVEQSDSSESSDHHITVPVVEQQVAAESEGQMPGVSAEDEGLVGQIADLMAVLQDCDEVDQLVLRNTGLTDALLHGLTRAISASRSEVKSINLNLNEIGPRGAQSIVHLLRDKPCMQSLLLYGNHLGAAGVQTLMWGLSDLWLSFRGSPGGFHLSELDIGGNHLATEGLRSVAAFLELNPPLRQLCLAQSSAVSWEAWELLFDALKRNTNLTHLLLDENNLGDSGARLVAEVIQENRSLLSLDLDDNHIGEEGGRAISQSLQSTRDSALINISLEHNNISTGTLHHINQSLAKCADPPT